MDCRRIIITDELKRKIGLMRIFYDPNAFLRN